MTKSILSEMSTLAKETKKYFMKNCTVDFQKMSETQGRIMRYMFEHHNDEISNKVLEVNLNLSKATVSDTLDRMESSDLIERIPSQKDARKKIIKMKATKDHARFDALMKEFERTLLMDIPEEDLDVFARVLQQMEANLRKEK